MIIQAIMVAAMVGVTFLLGQSTTSTKRIAFRRIVLVVFAVASVVAIMFPDLVQHAAEAVDLTRGADLILYALVVVFIGSLAMNSRRAIEGARKMTQLSRTIAIDDAEWRYGLGNRRPVETFRESAANASATSASNPSSQIGES